MARTYAMLRTDIWGDDDWRNLTPGAQWLYEYLLAAPTLSSAGVADWRPGRIAKLARTLTADRVEKYADELQASRFIITDAETEEVVLRSFLRHDGVLTNPNLWKSLGNDYAGIASASIRGVVARELQRLREENPDGVGRSNPWNSVHLQTILKAPSGTPSETPSYTPSPVGSDTGSHPVPVPVPVPEASLPVGGAKLKETRLPATWAPTRSHIDLARESGVDVIAEAEAFRLHAETHDRHAARWNAAFTTWLKKAKPSAGESAHEFGNQDWMLRA